MTEATLTNGHNGDFSQTAATRRVEGAEWMTCYQGSEQGDIHLSFEVGILDIGSKI